MPQQGKSITSLKVYALPRNTQRCKMILVPSMCSQG